MKRFQLFEFTDLAWWPNTLRQILTDYLGALITRVQPFHEKADLIREALHVSAQQTVVDLCSGGGGPWPELARAINASEEDPLKIILTDKFPDAGMSGLGTERVRYHGEPVDALNVPNDLKGVRTLFNGFHHFPPEAASAILEDAVQSRQAILVFELLQRNWLDLLAMILAPLNLWLLTPLIRPLRFSRFLLTYLIPIGPLVVLWDCLVSVLRCYTPAEMEAMAGQVDPDGTFKWSAGTYRHRGLPVTYMAGIPRSPMAAPIPRPG